LKNIGFFQARLLQKNYETTKKTTTASTASVVPEQQSAATTLPARPSTTEHLNHSTPSDRPEPLL